LQRTADLTHVACLRERSTGEITELLMPQHSALTKEPKSEATTSPPEGAVADVAAAAAPPGTTARTVAATTANPQH